MAQNLSVALAFVALLHLANEKVSVVCCMFCLFDFIYYYDDECTLLMLV